MAVLILMARYFKKIPGMIVVLFGGTAAAWLLQLAVEAIGTRFGGIPHGLPRMIVPEFHWEIIHPRADSLRSAAATRGADAPGGVRAARGAGKYLREYSGGAARADVVFRLGTLTPKKSSRAGV